MRALTLLVAAHGARAFNAPTPSGRRAVRLAAAAAPDEPKPTSTLGRTATFWKLATPAVTRYLTEVARINLSERLLGRCLSDEECEVIWDEANSAGGAAARSVVDELGGFYVKTGQIIASRQDLFPRQVTDALEGLTDLVDPLPSETVRGVVAAEALRPGEAWEDVFAEWDDDPLGAASVAQVHRAVLSEAYGGREVAVKVQRPGVEDTLLGDVRQLKALAKPARDVTPVDYYIVFEELEAQLADEFDFVAEAAAMERIKRTIDACPGGAPLVVPSVVPPLCSRRVLVMDYLRGEPLSRVAAKYDLTRDAAARAAGRALLEGLTEAFGRCIFETGFFHADPHPGNLLVLDDGRIGLIDFGQVKQISGRARATLGKVMCALATMRRTEAEPWGVLEDLRPFTALGRELGVVLADDQPEPEGPAAVSLWLFDDAAEPLPGGYEQSELSPRAPAQALQSFPQDLVLVARSSVLIKGLAAKLGVKWSLASEWAPIAVEALGVDHPTIRPRGRARRAVASVRARARRLVAPYVRKRLEKQRVTS